MTSVHQSSAEDKTRDRLHNPLHPVQHFCIKETQGKEVKPGQFSVLLHSASLHFIWVTFQNTQFTQVASAAKPYSSILCGKSFFTDDTTSRHAWIHAYRDASCGGPGGDANSRFQVCLTATAKSLILKCYFFFLTAVLIFICLR